MRPGPALGERVAVPRTRGTWVVVEVGTHGVCAGLRRECDVDDPRAHTLIVRISALIRLVYCAPGA